MSKDESFKDEWQSDENEEMTPKKKEKVEEEDLDIDSDYEDSFLVADIPDLIDDEKAELKDYKKELKKYEAKLKRYKRERVRLARKSRGTSTTPLPPLPPMPPIPPIPKLKASVSIDKDKVFGIRGLDSKIYDEILEKAKEFRITVGDLINRIFADYLEHGSYQFKYSIIEDLKSLEISEDELADLKNGSSLVIKNIQNLIIGPDVSPESFEKITEVYDCEHIWVPKPLYLLLLQKAKNCERIEKYTGDTPPKVITKSFDSDVRLSPEFFDYFLETGEKINLRIYGNLEIDEDISLNHLKEVIYALEVDGNLRAPKLVIGWIYAKAVCYGNIEAV